MLYTRATYRRLTSIDVLRPSRVSDGQGGWVHTYNKASSVTGYIQPNTLATTQRERMTADQQTIRITHNGYLPASADVTAEDRLRAGGKTYRVVGVMDTGGMGRYLTVELLEVGNNG